MIGSGSFVFDTSDCETIPFIERIGPGSHFIRFITDTVSGGVVFGGSSPNSTITITTGSFIGVIITRPDKVVRIISPSNVSIGGAVINGSI